MKKAAALARTGLKFLMVGGIAAFISACVPKAGAVVRYRMTVAVETPQGLKVGHAVREIRPRRGGIFIFGEGRPQWDVKGQAVEIELKPGRSLYALLANEKGQSDFAGRNIWFALDQKPDADIELWPTAPSGLRPEFSAAEMTPLLVTLMDRDDPDIMRLVRPNELRAHFGKGFRLKRISIQKVDEPITTGLETQIGWLSESNYKLPGPFRAEGIPGLELRPLFVVGR